MDTKQHLPPQQQQLHYTNPWSSLASAHKPHLQHSTVLTSDLLGIENPRGKCCGGEEHTRLPRIYATPRSNKKEADDGKKKKIRIFAAGAKSLPAFVNQMLNNDRCCKVLYDSTLFFFFS
jgi:hypothetical protein